MGTFSHDILIGRDFIQTNDLDIIVLDKNKNVVISSEDKSKEFDSNLMDEVFNGSNDTVLKVCECDETVMVELNVGDSQETQMLQRTVTELFVDNYIKREKPNVPLVKEKSTYI